MLNFVKYFSTSVDHNVIYYGVWKNTVFDSVEGWIHVMKVLG